LFRQESAVAVLGRERGARAPSFALGPEFYGHAWCFGAEPLTSPWMIPLGPSFTHSLTHWNAWLAMDRCALQTSRSPAMSQAAYALRCTDKRPPDIRPPDKTTLHFTTMLTRFFDEIEIFISLDASFW